MNPITVTIALVLVAVGAAIGAVFNAYAGAPFVLLALLVTLSLRMANAWEKFVVLRAGKLRGVRGPGLFFILPIVDSVTAVIHERIQTTAFNAEQALTKDTVPVNVGRCIG